MAGTLYLIPSALGPAAPGDILPAGVQARVRTLHYFIAERPRTARAFLKMIGLGYPLAEARIATLDEHTRPEALGSMLAPLADPVTAAAAVSPSPSGSAAKADAKDLVSFSSIVASMNSWVKFASLRIDLVAVP